jgi:DNA-binding transcriptional MerR regulator
MANTNTQKKQLSLEEVETRIHMYRDESRTISHRISALTERRKEINEKIKELKQQCVDLKSSES